MEVELDCTSNCKLTIHGDKITKALTKHEIDENKLIKYLCSICKGFNIIKDGNVSTKTSINSQCHYQEQLLLVVLGENCFNDGLQ